MQVETLALSISMHILFIVLISIPYDSETIETEIILRREKTASINDMENFQEVGTDGVDSSINGVVKSHHVFKILEQMQYEIRIFPKGN